MSDSQGNEIKEQRVITNDKKWYLIDSWDEWGKVFNKREYFLDIITNIMGKNDLIFDHINASYPGSNAVFILDNKYAVKIYPNIKSEEINFELECNFHNILQKNMSIKQYIPSLIMFEKYKVDNVNIKYCIMNCISSKNIIPIREIELSNINEKNLTQIGIELGSVIYHIHQTNVTKLIQSKSDWKNIDAINWKKYLKNIRTKTINALKDSQKDFYWNKNIKLKQEIIQFISNIKSINNNDSNIVLSHCDITDDHIYLKKLDNNKWKLNSIIDFGDMGLKQIEYEWIALWFGGTKQNKILFQSILSQYYRLSNNNKNYKINWKQMIHILQEMLFLHLFNLEIIKDVLSDKKIDLSHVKNLKHLFDILFCNLY